MLWIIYILQYYSPSQFSSTENHLTNLRHQREALDFMAQRELGPVPPAYSLWRESIDDSSGLKW